MFSQSFTHSPKQFGLLQDGMLVHAMSMSEDGEHSQRSSSLADK